MSIADDGETTLRLERLIAAPPELLFALWTDPAELVRWWPPDGCEASVDTLDTRPGGRWRTILRRADGGTKAMSGVYRIVEPPRRLSFTWAWEDAEGTRGHETEVTVSFEATAGGTRLKLVQQRFETSELRDRHTIGWATSLDRLALIPRSGGAS
jgi:uncharacterized protein YndB with AHSA1/START domain